MKNREACFILCALMALIFLIPAAGAIPSRLNSVRILIDFAIVCLLIGGVMVVGSFLVRWAEKRWLSKAARDRRQMQFHFGARR